MRTSGNCEHAPRKRHPIEWPCSCRFVHSDDKQESCSTNCSLMCNKLQSHAQQTAAYKQNNTFCQVSQARSEIEETLARGEFSNLMQGLLTWIADLTYCFARVLMRKRAQSIQIFGHISHARDRFARIAATIQSRRALKQA